MAATISSVNTNIKMLGQGISYVIAHNEYEARKLMKISDKQIEELETRLHVVLERWKFGKGISNAIALDFKSGIKLEGVIKNVCPNCLGTGFADHRNLE